MKKLKILVGCEESQAVTIELRKLGHEAFSCDLFECSGGKPEWHFLQDIFEIAKGGVLTSQKGITYLVDKWDAGIFFPPCTHLAVSGAKHFAKKIADGRQPEAINFFLKIAGLDIDSIAIENPVGIMSTHYKKPSQVIQPWQFGDQAQKTTCLWIKNLPLLTPTELVGKGDFYVTPTGKKMAKWMCDPVGNNGKKLGYNTPEIKKLRSKTFPGIAKAMAEQWSEYLTR